jgi:[citrate (pro-3S)-lyase] ligase
MAYSNVQVEYYNNPTSKQRKVFEDFLEKQDLEYEKTIELTIKLVDKATGEMIGTGSIDGKVLKCIAIDPERRGEGLSAKIISVLVKEQYKRGQKHIFVFTQPENIETSAGNTFQGFKVVAKTERIVLLEMGTPTIEDYLKDLKFQTRGLKDKANGKPIGSIVVNCNPFTLGHQYLIETAASECALLYVFVVTEDRSAFPTDVRYQLVKKGVSHLNNVHVFKGGDYIISPATFPRYFMKSFDNIVLSQARLDVTIFADYIAPALGINRRYVGEEPYCDVTNSYNQAMQEILTPKGIELKVIKRKEKEGKPISASTVRDLLKEEKFEEIRKLVPRTTYEYLISDDAKDIIKKLQQSNSRH